MDQVLIASGPSNFPECFELAQEAGLGLEIQAFAYPQVLESNLPLLLREYRAYLKDFAGPLALHGAFMDMTPGSLDPKIVAVTEERYRQNMDIAAELGATTIIFHANYLTNIRTLAFRQDWTQRQVVFWGRLVERAARMGLTLALENMWEWEPSIITDVILLVESPHLRACLDVGHAHLFSRVSFRNWLAVLGPYLAHAHLNNNGGVVDQHRGLDDGVIEYPAILGQLRALPSPPSFSLEIEKVADIRRSLAYFRLRSPQPA